MSLDPEDREYVVSSAVDILRHRKRERLLQILKDRLAQDDYDDEKERELDQVVLSLALAVDEQLGPPEG
jgi:hypothetical protein